MTALTLALTEFGATLNFALISRFWMTFNLHEYNNFSPADRLLWSIFPLFKKDYIAYRNFFGFL